jgi:hypothetical protein
MRAMSIHMRIMHTCLTQNEACVGRANHPGRVGLVTECGCGNKQSPSVQKSIFAASSDSRSIRHKVHCFVWMCTMVCSNGSCSKKGTKRCSGCGQVRSVGSLCTHAQRRMSTR